MGAIQQELGGLVSTAMGAVAVGKHLKQQEEQIKETKALKEEQHKEAAFNAAMKETELPVLQAQSKLDASEAKRQKELLGSEEQMKKEVAKAHEEYKEAIEDPEVNESEAYNKFIHDRAVSVEQQKGREFNINAVYDEQKIKLAKKVATKQAKAKKMQAKLIKDRLAYLRGGNQ